MAISAGFILPHPPIAVPAVGKGEEQAISDTLSSFREVARQIAEIEPELIIITSPHTAYYADYIHVSPGDRGFGDLGMFRAPQVQASVSYDEEFATHLIENANANGIPAGFQGETHHELDHGILVPLSFIQKELPTTAFDVLRLGGSSLPRQMLYDFGKHISEVALDRDVNAVMLASGDLSHKLKSDGPYGYAPQGPQFDKEVCEIIESGVLARFMDIDPELAEGAAECGLSGFIMLAGALDGLNFDSELLSYEGPFGVGYACGSFLVEDE